MLPPAPQTAQPSAPRLFNVRGQTVVLDSDLARLDGVTTAALRDLYHKIKPLLLPPPAPPRREIGFHAKN